MAFNDVRGCNKIDAICVGDLTMMVHADQDRFTMRPEHEEIT
jgi:hypothetical protein